MNPNFKPRSKAQSNIASNEKRKEKSFIKKWIKSKDVDYLQKFRNMPEVIVSQYEQFLNDQTIDIGPHYTPGERLHYIKELLDWYLNLEPRFKKLLKITGLTNVQFAQTLGYKTGANWYNSSSKLRVIRGFLEVFDRYQGFINKLHY